MNQSLRVSTLLASTLLLAAACSDPCSLCPEGHLYSADSDDCRPAENFETGRICQDVYEPVCGCDGETHGNACYAAAEGVDVAYSGQCALAGGLD